MTQTLKEQQTHLGRLVINLVSKYFASLADLPAEAVAETFLANERLHGTKFDSFAVTRLTELIKRARVDGALTAAIAKE